MPHSNVFANLDDDYEWIDHRIPDRDARPAPRVVSKKRNDHVVMDEIIRYRTEAINDEMTFHPTFQGSRYERTWILEYLGPFYEMRAITDVLRRAKGGKEANVYCCAGHPDTGLELIAAKVYRPRMFRNLRNDARYRQARDLLDQRGKTVRDRRMQRAVDLNTNTGKEARHVSWLEHEYQTLSLLYQAGAAVPQPVKRGNNTILMEYIGAVDLPAPSLNEVNLPAKTARPLFETLLENVELMLRHHKIHGDLSAFNVLYWEGRVWMIDFPQAVDPRTNPEAYAIFRRDVERLCQYFERYRVVRNAVQTARVLAQEMWARNMQANLLPDEPLDLI